MNSQKLPTSNGDASQGVSNGLMDATRDGADVTPSAPAAIPIDPALFTEKDDGRQQLSEKTVNKNSSSHLSNYRHHPYSRPESMQPANTTRSPSLQVGGPPANGRSAARSASPAVVTATSTPASSREKKKAPIPGYLQNSTQHNYVMPGGHPLNFTIVEINCLLMTWYMNEAMAQRFQNNGITGRDHLAMVMEYCDLKLSKHDQSKGREGITDRYRKTMRRADSDWTKLGHRAPTGWNADNLSVNNFVPDVTQEPDFEAPRPIPLHFLNQGLKKLPTGPDAGDLTRALQYAMDNKKIGMDGDASDFMFPDDLHEILQVIGYTQVTPDHSDKMAIKRQEEGGIKPEPSSTSISPSQKQSKPKSSKQQSRIKTVAQQTPAVVSPQEENPLPTVPRLSHAQQAQLNVQFYGHGQEVRQALQIPGTKFDNITIHNTPSGARSLPGITPTSVDRRPEIQQDPSIMGSATSNGKFDHQHTSVPTPVSGAAYSNVSLNGPAGANLNGDVNGAVNGSLTSLAHGTANGTANATASELPSKPSSNSATQDAHPELIDLTSNAHPNTSFRLDDIIDDIIALNQDFDLTSLLAQQQQQVDLSHGAGIASPRLIYLCAEGDDPNDHSDLARAARWCREPENFATMFTEDNIGLVLGLMEAEM